MRDKLIVLLTVVACGLMCWVSFAFGFNSGQRKATIDAIEVFSKLTIDKFETSADPTI